MGWLRGIALFVLGALLTVPGALTQAAPQGPERPSPALDPNPVDFGDVVLGQVASEVVTLTNMSTSEVMSIITVLVAAPFERLEDECGLELEPLESCDITIGFSPLEPGRAAGSVEVVYRYESSSSVSVGILANVPDPSPPPPPNTEPPTEPGPPISIPTTSDDEETPPRDDSGDSDVESPEISPPEATTATTVAASASTLPEGVTPTTLPLDECRALARNAEIRPPQGLTGVVGENLPIDIPVNLPGSPVPSVDDPAPATTIIVAALDCQFEATLSASDDDVEIVSDASFDGDLSDGNAVVGWIVRPLRSGLLTLTVTVRPTSEGSTSGDEIGPEVFELDVRAEEQSTFDSLSDSVGDLTDEPILRAIPLFAAIVAAVAALWKWVLRKPWPWARGLVGADEDGDEAEEPEDPGSGGYL